MTNLAYKNLQGLLEEHARYSYKQTILPYVHINWSLSIQKQIKKNLTIWVQGKQVYSEAWIRTCG